MNISVVIPTYKRPDLLSRLLASIANQTLFPNEIIVIDDCSGMQSDYMKCIEQYRQIFANLHYEVLQINSGAPVARNKGISLAKGEWIALVDDDDEWLPTKLEKQWNLISNHPDERLGLVYTWAHALGKAGMDSYDSCHSIRGDGRKALLSTNFILSPSVMVKREAILQAGCFDARLPSCQDWDTWVQICLKGYHIDVVEEIVTVYHRHGGESIGLSPKAKLGYKLFLEKHYKDIVKHTSLLNIAKKIWLYVKVWSAVYGKA